MHVQRSFAVMTVASLSFLLAGCAHRNNQQMPATMTTPGIVILNADQVNSNDKIAKALAQVAQDYRAAISSNNLPQAKILRNRFVFTIMGQIDADYGTFERSLRNKRAAVQTVTDAALAGLTAATAVVGEAGIKDMLSAAVAAGSATRLSAEKNFFNDEGTIALLTQMRASRNVIAAQITKRCANDVTQYSLEEAWKDLNRYVNAGSIESAMVQLAANAGSQSADADQQVANAIQSVTTPATTQNVIDSQQERAIAYALITAIQPTDGSTPNATTLKSAADAIVAILASINNAPPAGTDPATLVTLLRTVMKNAANDVALNTNLLKAMTAAPAQFGGTGK